MFSIPYILRQNARANGMPLYKKDVTRARLVWQCPFTKQPLPRVAAARIEKQPALPVDWELKGSPGRPGGLYANGG
jgi:hypothetical protein